MKRLRLVFVLLAVVLLVPVLLLVRWALDSVAADTQARHRVLAERLFDEMEREVGNLLEREEARPFAQYRYLYAPEESVKGAVGLRRSPLADPPAEGYVVGYFQIDPDGTFSSPRIPRDRAAARRRDVWSPSPEVEGEVDGLFEFVSARWGRLARPRRTAGPLGSRLQRPGTTVALRTATTAGLDGRATDDEQPQQEERSLYESFGSLNRAVSTRGARTQKLAQVQAQDVFDYKKKADKADRGRGKRGKVADRRIRNEVSSGGAAEDGDRSVADGARVLDADSDGWRDLGWAAPAPRDPESMVEVQLEPMVAAVLDPDHVLLYRTVFTASKTAVRQGMVLDVPRLTQHLADAALGGTDLSSFVTLAFSTNGMQPQQGARGDYIYRHRFAEPFGTLSATATLRALPIDGGATYIYVLAWLLILVGTVGLFALYRMVSVVVGYAERRSNFVSAVTHELKTPLTSIRMYGEMLRDGMVDSDEKRHQYYETITAESERLTRLINNVLELSRLEKRGRPMSLVVGSPADVVSEVVGIVGPHARKEGFELDVQIADGLPAVSYDRDALLQVTLNLIDNAFKYAKDASDRRVTLRLAPADGSVLLSVRDHGPGVAPEHLRHIFDPFYRGENELTRKTKGTGIGLSLVRGLVERMGGTVYGRNVEDGGFLVEVALSPAAG